MYVFCLEKISLRGRECLRRKLQLMLLLSSTILLTSHFISPWCSYVAEVLLMVDLCAFLHAVFLSWEVLLGWYLIIFYMKKFPVSRVALALVNFSTLWNSYHLLVNTSNFKFWEIKFSYFFSFISHLSLPNCYAR